jgi:glucose-6-phosphate isomerase
MNLDLQKLLEGGAIDLSKLRDEAGKIPEFLESFKNREQGFVELTKVRAHVLAAKKVAEKFRDFEDIVILGIGGSALGITCLMDALKGPFWNNHGKPRLFVLDNLDLVEEVEKVINVDKTLFVVISKSGATPETMAQYFYFREKVSRENFVFITDPAPNELRKIGEFESIPILDIPLNVGGRFSVLTSVGLFPAILLGIDVEELLAGAEEMSANFMSKDFNTNYPFQFAAIQYLLEWERGIHMTVMMPYSSKLYSLADWYAQLLAESIGKDGKGLTPVKALGATDQHSQLQLYNEGPNDKLIVFIEVEDEKSPKIPQITNEKLSYLSGITFNHLLNVEKVATEKALNEYKKATLTVKIPKICERELGKLFMLFEASIAFLGEYYRIDAFNQPGVELGKKLTKEILTQND